MSTGFGYTELEPVMLDMDPFGDKRDNCIIHMGAGTVIGTLHVPFNVFEGSANLMPKR